MLGDSLLAALEAAANALAAAGIRHALVGGAALPAWGRIRATGDADVLISAGLGSPEITARLQEIVAALRGGGFAHLDRADRRRIEDKTVLHFWFPLRPQGISVRLDLIAGEGPEYDELLDRAVRRKINGFDIPVASCEDLILLKLAAGRAIDLADVQELLKINGPNLDRIYLRSRAASRRLEKKLEEAWKAAGS